MGDAINREDKEIGHEVPQPRSQGPLSSFLEKRKREDPGNEVGGPLHSQYLPVSGQKN